MKRLRIGIVDYSVGNHTSVKNSIERLGCGARLSHDRAILENNDLLILPGVGAFAVAMAALHYHHLVDFLRSWVWEGRPLLGICLGMQLLAEQGHEGGLTSGLGLIPGEVVSLGISQWHIGWNHLKICQRDPLLVPFDNSLFYFNHSFVFKDGRESVICQTEHGRPFPSVVRNGSVVGLQFHPEKSQEAGLTLLRHLIQRLCHA